MPRSPRIWWNKQKHSWCSEVGGKRHTLAKGKANKRQAEEALRKLVAEQQMLAEVNGAVTVAGLCEAFLEDAFQNLEPKTYQSYCYSCQKLVDLFGTTPAHKMEPLDIAKFSRELKKSLNPTSQAIVLRVVQRCFNWGVENRLIPPHKLGRIRKPRPLRRDRFLTDQEFQLVVRSTHSFDHRHSGAEFRRFLLALDWTFSRPGELVRLKWEHVHFDQRVAVLPDHKTKRTGKPKIIPLIPKMERLLRWLTRRHKSEYCFVNSLGKPWTLSAINQRMVRLRKRSGLTGVFPYTIRHRAATNAILKTGDLKMTSLLLGHTSTATTERYTHLAQEHLVNFAEKATASREGDGTRTGP